MADQTTAITQDTQLIPLSMKLRFLYDISMFIVFMTMYSLYSPFIATYALLGMSTAKMAGMLTRKERIKLLDWVEFAFLTTFCVATLAFHAAIFIKIKAPLLGVLFVLGMIGYTLSTDHSFMKRLFAKDFGLPDMPENTWKKIDYMVITNLLLKAAIVFTIIFAFSDTIWYYSNFVLPIFDFTMLASIYLISRPHLNKEPSLDMKAPSEQLNEVFRLDNVDTNKLTLGPVLMSQPEFTAGGDAKKRTDHSSELPLSSSVAAAGVPAAFSR